MASTLDGLSEENPKSSIVNPVSPANPEAAIFNCSTNGVILAVVNCPTDGLSPSSSFVNIIKLEIVAFRLSTDSASWLTPRAYF